MAWVWRPQHGISFHLGAISFTLMLIPIALITHKFFDEPIRRAMQKLALPHSQPIKGSQQVATRSY